MEYPVISVIIPTYGRASMLKNAIESVLAQTYGSIEIIVVDDNGLNSDNQLVTAEQVSSFNNENIRYIPLEQNSGGAFARNVGARMAKGAYLCFLDDDDCFLKEKVERQFNAIKAKPDSVACYCGHIRRNQKLGTEKVYMPTQEGDCRLAVMTFSVDFCSGSTLLVRKDAFEKAGGFDIKLKRFQDYQFLAMLSCLGNIECVPQPLTIINTHEGSYCLKSFSQIEENRKAYMLSIKHAILTLPKTQQLEVYESNILFLVKEAIRHKEFKTAFLYIRKSKRRVKTLLIVMNDMVKFIFKTKFFK